MANPTLSISVKLKDMFSKQFKGMAKTTGTQSKKMSKSMAGMSMAAGKLKGAIAGVVAAYVGWAGVRKAWSAVKTYAKLQAVERGFETLRGQIDASKNAVVGWNAALYNTVSHADLLEQANIGIVSGLIESEDEFRKLAEASLFLSRAYGKEVLPTLQQLIQSLSSASPRALRALGIDMEKMFELERKRVGSSGVLAQEVKQRMMISAIFKKSVELQSTMTEEQKSQLTLLEKIQQGEVDRGDALENIGSNLTGMVDAMNEFSVAWEKLSETTLPVIISQFATMAGSIDKFLKGMDFLGRDIGDWMFGNKSPIPEKTELGKRIEALNKSILLFKSIGQTSRAQKATKKVENLEKEQFEIRAREEEQSKERRLKLDAARKQVRENAKQTSPYINKKITDIKEYVVSDTSLMSTTLEAAKEAKKAAASAAIDFAEETRQFNESIWGATRDAVVDYVNFTGTVLDQFAFAVTDTFGALENTLGNVFFDAMTGKMKSFKEYVRSFVQDITSILAQMLAKQAVLGLINGIGGLFAPGTTTTSAGGVNSISPTMPGVDFNAGGYGGNLAASGGIYDSPVIAGEAGAEAIIPLPGNRKVPVELSGGGGGRVVNVSFNIQTNDAGSFRSSLAQNQDMLTKIFQKALGSDAQLRSTVRAV